jgi:hypothetical protein
MRPVWSLSYEVCVRAVAALLRRHCDASVYVTGTFAQDEPVFGMSDLDLVAVAPAAGELPGSARRRLGERWLGLCRRVPLLSLAVTEVFAYEEAELRAAVSSTCLTYGVDSRSRAGATSFFGPDRLADEAGLQVRPTLWPAQGWRLVAGRDVRPVPTANPDDSRLRAWLELQFWWRFAFDLADEPERGELHSFQIPFLCVKLVAEPVRILLSFVHGERVLERKAALERGLELFAAETPAIERALDLLGRLHRSPRAELADFLPTLVRLSSLLAEAIAADVDRRGVTEVALVGGTPPRVAPLADWLARVKPRPEEETFMPVDDDPGDRDQLAAAVRSYRPGVYRALRANRLLVLPATAPRRLLRSVHCAESDPVSFALADGLQAARFPDVPGWSARDGARRAVAEHRGWLASQRASVETLDATHAAESLGMLLSAVRAALFLESLEREDPRLPVTYAAAAELLSSRSPGVSTVAAEAYDQYRKATLDGRAPSNRTLTELFRIVRELPAYRAAGPATPRRALDRSRAPQ